MLNREKSLVEPEEGKKIKQIQKIKLKGVNFQYIEDQPVLNDVTINFDEGKISALVGESGCGKSTIVQLLMRFYDSGSGSLTING